MKAKIVINTWVSNSGNGGVAFGKFDIHGHMESSEVWSGELEIKPENAYLLKFSIIAEGQAHPIVDVPFSTSLGHWIWVPPSWELDEIGAAIPIPGMRPELFQPYGDNPPKENEDA
jgi:hypothetical protein